jgi:hypothetical protein
VYAREIGGKTLTFGVSGLLYRSNVLMYDHQTESLWLQVKRRAVTGPMTGTRLPTLPSTITTWKKWKGKYPTTTVLSFETGHRRDYSRDPYEDYYRRKRGIFSSFFHPGPGEEEKEMVAGINADGKVKAYPVETIQRQGKITDTLGKEEITFTYDAGTDRILVRTKSGTEIEPVIVYWFVWKGIYPDTERYGSENGELKGIRKKR